MSIEDVNELCKQVSGKDLPEPIKEGLINRDEMTDVIYNALKLFE